MIFDIITIFPKIFDPYFKESIVGRAQKKKLVKIKIHNLRDYTKDKHKTIDDKPYGGGPGMLMKVEPIYKAIKSISTKAKQVSNRSIKQNDQTKIILFSPKGKKFTQAMAKKFSRLSQLIMICGRYEGVDERVAKHIVDQEISIGDYVLTGGEIPAMVVVDAVTRLVSGVIAFESLKEESFNKTKSIKEYPQYTRPERIAINNKQRRVPKILLSGNHKEIKKWREKHKT